MQKTRAPILALLSALSLLGVSLALGSEEGKETSASNRPECQAKLHPNWTRIAVKEQSRLDEVLTDAQAPRVWTQAFLLNVSNIFAILDKIKHMPGGLIPEQHPWVTGLSPVTGKSVWAANIVFRIDPDKPYKISDEEMVTRTGKYLASFVRKSASSQKFPLGMPQTSKTGDLQRRMPHAINYIHGSAHFNCGWFIFNNFKEAYFYFSDPAFQAEVLRFAKEEDREISLLFRDGDYNPEAYGELSAFLRTVFPWYSNVNGPKDMVHWGSKAPFPTVNMITGAFLNDLKKLETEGGVDRVAREPLDARRYFQAQYQAGVRAGPRWFESAFAKALELRVRTRGKAKGNLFFVDKRKLDAITRAKQLKEVRQLSDEETGLSWSTRREMFFGKMVEVHDISHLEAKEGTGLVPLPFKLDPERDIIIGFKPKTFHSFIIAGDKEFHATLLYRNPAKVLEARRDQLIASVFIRLKGVPAETVKTQKEKIQELEGIRTLTCVNGNCITLKEGSEIRLKQHFMGHLSASGFFRGLVKHGLIDAQGKPIEVEIYITGPESLEDIYREILQRMDLRWGWVLPFGVAAGYVLENLNITPETPVRLDLNP